MSKYEEMAKRRAGFLTVIMIMIAVLLVLISAVFSQLHSEENAVKRDLFPTGIEAESTLQFHEIMASNKSWDITGGLTQKQIEDGKTKLPDWIELYNRGETSIRLYDYAIYKGSSPDEIFRFGDEQIAPGGYLVLIADGKSKADDGYLHLPFKISSSGDTLVMMNSSGEIIDSVTTPSLEKDEVYVRDGHNRWTRSISPTPGAMNRITTYEEKPEPQDDTLAPVISKDQIRINEIMSSNVTYATDPDGKNYDYIEIYNSADFDANLLDWTLTRGDQPDTPFRFPEITVPSKGYMLVYCAGSEAKKVEKQFGTPVKNGIVYASFRLPSAGCNIVFTRSDGQVIDDIEVPPLDKDRAYSLVNGHWTQDYAPTPGYANDRSGVQAVHEQILMNNRECVYINEISASSSMSASDWIEIYNGGVQPVDLTGYGLTDNAGKKRKWQFPMGTLLQPGAYLQVFCGEEDAYDLCAPFRLSVNGHYPLMLVRSDGVVIDRVYVGPQYRDITYGRGITDGSFRYYTDATPLSINGGEAYDAKAAPPTYSVRGGLFPAGEPVEVTLSTAEPGLQIHYTLDQTDPTEESPIYTQPLVLTENTVLRTKVYGENTIPSASDTQTYLFDVNNGDGVYVVSLVSDPHNLISNEAGIMVKGSNAAEEYPYKGANFWQDWEVEGHVEIYDGEGNQVLSEGCGIKLHGQYSRAESQQAFKVIARGKYGAGSFKAKLFSNRDYEEYQSFLLRSSGQDTNMSRMRDSVLSSLASDTSVMYMESEVCVLYIDGYYWGQYYLRERVNTASICQFEGWEGQEDALDLIKANKNVMQGSNETFAELLEWIKNADPKDEGFYDHVGEIIDIKNYMEYMSLEIFSGNGDTLNVKRYRNKLADGKWRWVLFDLDWAFFVDTDSINRWLSPGGMGTNKYTDNSLFIACMKNPRFRDEFLTLMGQRMATVYTTDNLMAKFGARYEVLQPLMDDQLARWEQTNSSFTQQLRKLLDYAKTRPARLMKYFRNTEYLGLTDEDMEHYFGDALELVGGLEAALAS